MIGELYKPAFNCLTATYNGNQKIMANHKQAKKRIRQIERRTGTNSVRRTRIRTFIRKVDEAIKSGNQDAAKAALQVAQPEMARGAKKGIFHKKTMSRKISRLSASIKKMAA